MPLSSGRSFPSPDRSGRQQDPRHLGPEAPHRRGGARIGATPVGSRRARAAFFVLPGTRG